MTYSVPKVINQTLKYISPDFTVIYLDLFEQAMKIESHHRDYIEAKIKHFGALHKMHFQLQECKGVKLSIKHVEAYESFFRTFLSTFKSIKREELKRDGFRILRYYMTAFYLEILAPLDDIKKKEDILFNTMFMSDVTDAILVDLDNYYESVKEEAQLLLICMV